MASSGRETFSPELPRAPSLELSVLPSGGGQNPNRARNMPNRLYYRSGECCYGADRDRTGGLCSAIAALSQLSYSPAFDAAPKPKPSSHHGKGPATRGAAPDNRKSRKRRLIRQVDGPPFER